METMKRKSGIKTLAVVAIILLAGLAGGYAILKIPVPSQSEGHGDEHGHGHEEEEESAGGHGHEDGDHPHGGDGHGDHDEHGEAEDHVAMDESTRIAAGIGLDTVGPAEFRENLEVIGRIAVNEEALAHVFPRFAGVVKKVFRQLGDRVARGDTLALIESNESLRPYALIAQIKGTVIRKHAGLGETVGTEEELFAIADLATVWADLQVPRQDFAKVKLGQTIRIAAEGDDRIILAKVGYLSPMGEIHSQNRLVRAVLENRDGRFAPGLFVQGEIQIAEYRVAMAIQTRALQNHDGGKAVFVRGEDSFRLAPVELGRKDGEWVEVIAGLSAGDAYATANSFVVKADLGKGEAGHDH